MEEVWKITRIRRRTVYGTRPNRSTFEHPIEEIVTSVGSSHSKALLQFEVNERIKYENTSRPTPKRRSNRWA
jgi:hypothetical protein